MASDWLGVNAGNIASGWGRAPELQGRELGGMIAAILRDRLEREQQQTAAIANTIRNVRGERQSNQYIDALKRAGLVGEEYEAGGLGGATLAEKIAKFKLAQDEEARMAAQQGYMKPYYEALTERAGRPDAPGGRGTPRYPYTIPGTGETVGLTGGELARRRAEESTTGSYQGLLKSEADAKATMQELETKWGGTIKGQLKGAPAWPWQEDTTKEERLKDQILYNRAQQQFQMNQQQRENLEKRKPGIVGGAPAPADTTDTGDQDSGGSDTTPEPALSEKDREAFEWAQANPTDPRAKAILARLGIR